MRWVAVARRVIAQAPTVDLGTALLAIEVESPSLAVLPPFLAGEPSALDALAVNAWTRRVDGLTPAEFRAHNDPATSNLAWY